MLFRGMVRIGVALLAVFYGGTGLAMAQAVAAEQPATGAIRGVATDDTGAAVPDVRVTVMNDATALRRESTTNDEGSFAVPLLPPGEYTLRAERPGFAIHEVRGITVRASDEVTLRVQLKVDAVTEAVVVTAQKRGDERLQDVPVPVSVLEADRLVNRNQLRLQDYAATVPGLNVGLSASIFQMISIRGVTTASTSANPKVGILIDDVPYGASTHRGGGLFVPDIDPDDLTRVEVLKGPQGTLYGAGSLGGLINYITDDPSTDKIRGRIHIGLTSVAHGSDPGYNIRASVNVPVNQTLAISASGFTREEPGYIDNVETGEDDYNTQRVSGGRLAASWRPSSNLSLKLSAIYQDYKGDGPNEIALQPNTLEPAAADLQIPYLRNTGEYEKKTQLYSAVLKAKLAGMDVASVTGYGRFDPVSTQDFSTAVPFDGLALRLYGVSGVKQDDGRYIRKWTQELRVSIPIGGKADWLVGGFYTHEQVGQFQNIWPVDRATGNKAGDLYIFSGPSTFAERAVFSGLTYRFTGRFDAQAGVRRSAFDHSVQFTFSGPYVPEILRVPSPLVLPRGEQDASPTTYLLTPRFRVSPDTMVYARVASGYGVGGLTFFPGTGAFQPFGPERTRNYEVGVKSSFLDRRASVDLSIYHIDYDDIQISLRDTSTGTTSSGLTYTANGGTAKSEGVELSLSVRPPSDLAINGWVAYNNAILTEPLGRGALVSTVTGDSGDRLPGSGRWSSYLSLEKGFLLFGTTRAVAGVSTSYVDERLGLFTAAGTPRRVYPSYTKTDLYGRVEHGTWDLTVFLNNVTDKRGAIWGEFRGATPILFQVQPRTFGMSFSKDF